jgi:hypothetical protein
MSPAPVNAAFGKLAVNDHGWPPPGTDGPPKSIVPFEPIWQSLYVTP